MSGPDPFEAGSGTSDPLADPATVLSTEAGLAEPEEMPPRLHRFLHAALWKYLLVTLLLLLLLGLGGMMCSPVYWRF
jgi:hypothetical protein